MEKVNLEKGNAALERVLLMMKYDMGKTLNENKGVVNEQDAPKGYLEIIGAAEGDFGTDENRMIRGFKELETLQDFLDLNNYYKSKWRREIPYLLRKELGTNDAWVAKEIADHLKTIGVKMTYSVSADKRGVVSDTIKISFSRPKEQVKPEEKPEEKPEKKSQPNITQWVQAPSEEQVKGGSKYVKFGMKGDFVKKIQQALNDIATSEGNTNLNVGKVDGYFGKNTKQGLKNFQVSAGLKDDGVLGKDTYSVLFREVSTPVALATKGLSLPSVDTPKSGVQRTPSLQNAHVEPKSTIKESLKKNLKQTLTEKRQLEENLIIERKIVSNRYNLIGNGVILETEDQQIRFVESIIAETQYLAAQGYSSEVINEQLFDMIGSLFKGSFTSVPAVFGEYIASWLLKTLGLPKDSYMGGVIIALVGNLNISDYDKFFTDCRFATNKIADSLIEGYIIKLQNEKSMNQGAGGFVLSALRNAVVDYFTEDKSGLIEKLEEKLGEFICPKLSKVSSKMGDVAQSVKDKAMA